MYKKIAHINELLINIYNIISKIEHLSLKQGEFKDLSTTEIHTIEAIGMYGSKTMSEIANLLSITTGTLTIAVNKLIKKGYLEKNRSKIDKRIVNVNLTKKGKLAYRIHEKFHTDMVKEMVIEFTPQEEKILMQGLNKLDIHLKKIYEAFPN